MNAPAVGRVKSRMAADVVPARRRMAVEDRRDQLVRVGVELIATRPWDSLTMAEIATAAHVSKPLLYHYFSTKTDLYIEAVRHAAEELREATKADPSVVRADEQLQVSLRAHVDWVEANASAYRAVLQGGLSGDPAVRAIVEQSRQEVVDRIAGAIGMRRMRPALRIAIRGWIGYLEAACLDWLAHRDLSNARLVHLLAASLPPAIAAADA